MSKYIVEVGPDGHLYVDEEKVEEGKYAICRVSPDIIPSVEELEKLMQQHEAFGFGQLDSKGFHTHGFDPNGLHNFVFALHHQLQDNLKKFTIENKDKP